MVVGVLLWRARRPGIRCQTVFLTHLWVLAMGIDPHKKYDQIEARDDGGMGFGEVAASPLPPDSR